MSGDERLRLERLVLKAIATLNGTDETVTTRMLRSGVRTRAANVDEALQALESKGQVERKDSGWVATRRGRTRVGHATARRRRVSGAQLPFRLTVDYLTVMLLNPPEPVATLGEAQRIAEAAALELLSDRQRARMLARHA